MNAGGAVSALHRDLVRTYGTPLYVYRLDAVRRAVEGLRRTLPAEVEVYYSVKANPHPLLVRTVAAAGLRLEISSTGELAAASAAGVPGDRCLYTGPAKTTTEMAQALRRGVCLFSVESPRDRDRLAEASRRPAAIAPTAARYLIRLNGTGTPAAAGLRMTGAPSQFGVPVNQLMRGGPLLTPDATTRPVGFHVFSATNLVDQASLLAELSTNLDTVAATAERTGLRPELADLGGGFAAPFAVPGELPTYPELRGALAAVLDDRVPGWRAGDPTVAVESGRHVVATAGTLLTTVMDVKAVDGRTYVLCDAGVNALGGMSGLGRLLPPGAQPAGAPAQGGHAVLAGPLCTPLDVLSRAAHVSTARAGDVLALPNVGAYGLTASLVAFLGRPLPVEAVLDGTSLVDARQLVFAEKEVGGGADALG